MTTYITGSKNSYISRIDVDFSSPTEIYGNFGREVVASIPGPEPIATVEIIVPYTDPIMDLIHKASKLKTPLNILRTEWQCLYCASPVEAERTHCPQCGGARGWIL